MAPKRESPGSLAEQPGLKMHSEVIGTQSHNITLHQSSAKQLQRILKDLQQGNQLSTLQAREGLGIMHPAARVMELRKAGFSIITHKRAEHDTTGTRHSVAEYVLLSGSEVA